MTGVVHGTILTCPLLVAEPGDFFDMEASPQPESQDDAAKRARRKARTQMMHENLWRSNLKFAAAREEAKEALRRKGLGPSKLGAKILDSTKAMGSAQAAQTATEPELKD